jgi:D-alanyl-D-alanine carboxypeptidase (penicillin-binding protein 5/6)
LGVNLPWSDQGQSAIGAVGLGVLDTHGEQKPVPIASVAKIVTALMVLKQKPLKPGEPGPILILSEADVGLYQGFVAQGGSVVPVQAGEQISEYQALEAMLLPSANNMAYSLATWAYGSVDKYNEAANKYIVSLGLGNTQITDPSGFSSTTTSTASDLVVIGEQAMDNQVVAKIVGETTATVPVAGVIQNTNFILGNSGIIGIKTGHTAEAGGCYLFASEHVVSNQKITAVGALIGQNSIQEAIINGQKLAQSMPGSFTELKLANNKVASTYRAAWGENVAASPRQDIDIVVWKNSQVKISSSLEKISQPRTKDTTVGSLNINANNKTYTYPLALQSDLTWPSFTWRLTH